MKFLKFDNMLIRSDFWPVFHLNHDKQVKYPSLVPLVSQFCIKSRVSTNRSWNRELSDNKGSYGSNQIKLDKIPRSTFQCSSILWL